MNKKFLKALALVGCALLLVTASVVGTYAFLTDKTDPIQNTFTAGNVSITLDEAKVNVYGVKVDETTRVIKNEYKLIPGKTYTKDPTIHVDSTSEKCYLFVKVVNGIAAIEGGTTIATQLTDNDWTALTGVTGVEGVYYKVWTPNVDATDVPVFATFTIDSSKDVSGYITLENASAVIEVTGYAAQFEGMTDAKDAWTKANFS